MIDVYTWTTGNSRKVPIFLEEVGVPYRLHMVDIHNGEQFKPEFVKICPNSKVPAIIDHAPADGGAPISIFESGAILWYLAEKTGKFLPSDVRGKVATSEWLFWQMAGFGPMTGQYGHFTVYAPEKIDYAIDLVRGSIGRLREMSPLWEMVQEGIDISKIEWAAH